MIFNYIYFIILLFIVKFKNIQNQELYVDSIDSGENANVYWSSITSDHTGKYLAATGLFGGIYTSDNFGTAWNLSSAPDFNLWIGFILSFQDFYI